MRNDNTQQNATYGEKVEHRPPTRPARDQAAKSWSNNRSQRCDHPNIGKAFSGGEADKQIAYNREGNDGPCRSVDSLKKTAGIKNFESVTLDANLRESWKETLEPPNSSN